MREIRNKVKPSLKAHTRGVFVVTIKVPIRHVIYITLTLHSGFTFGMVIQLFSCLTARTNYFFEHIYVLAYRKIYMASASAFALIY